VKVVNLTEGSDRYTSNAWLVTGTWRGLDDRTTLVDTGTDPAILDWLAESDPGLGKRKLDQIVLTHNHYDHTGMVTALRQAFGATVLAWSDSRNDVETRVREGQRIRMGDREFEVMHMPGHSQDSILLFNAEDGVLFSGDSPLHIRSPGGAYEPAFLQVLERLTRLPVQIIYPGHGEPYAGDCTDMLAQSLANARAGRKESDIR
jgi:glyoxylase-like metal-dependent hydrolase (beta-lactamase superfamily II)